MSRVVKRCKAHTRNRKNKSVWKPTRPAKTKDERRSDEILEIITDMSRKFDGMLRSKKHYPKIIVCSTDFDEPGKFSVDIETSPDIDFLHTAKYSESPSSVLLRKTLEDNPIKIEHASLYGSVPKECSVFIAPDSIYLNTTENGK